MIDGLRAAGYELVTVSDLLGSKPTGQTLYVVRPGDTLYRIAVKYGVTVQAIVAANNITNPNPHLPEPGAGDPDQQPATGVYSDVHRAAGWTRLPDRDQVRHDGGGHCFRQQHRQPQPDLPGSGAGHPR